MISTAESRQGIDPLYWSFIHKEWEGSVEPVVICGEFDDELPKGVPGTHYFYKHNAFKRWLTSIDDEGHYKLSKNLGDVKLFTFAERIKFFHMIGVSAAFSEFTIEL